ncbi:flagellar hook protein FlgE [Perlucidibaca piscinae]|uniref:flagellar hook protein FlgE n=1 Tax=Perlucidibaca piscinae TaxID=392589 RepID=UPI0003B6D3C1|nr:flagellar hook protein FlgE [Perlucidibaca piscinae]
MSFQIALSGLNAARSHLDVTAHNIANVNTAGFKSSRAMFSDVFATASNDLSSTASGSGVQVSSIQQKFSQGNVDFTNNNLDMAISGEGFFVMKGREGTVYSRAGAFSVDREGYVVNDDQQRLQVFPVSENGDFATGSLSDIRLLTTESPPQATTDVEIGINLPANAPVPAGVFDANNPSTYNHATSMTVYDSLGTPHTATVYFSKTSTDNAWEQRLFVDGTERGTTQTVTFDAATGKLATPAAGTLPPVTITGADLGTGSADMVLNFNYGESTQYGQNFGVNSLFQDGYSTGRMTGVEVDKNGVVSARFTNGQLKLLGQVALAIFSNPNGMQQMGETSWAETFSSGGPRLGQGGSSNFGLLQAGALEASNVDLTEQLVEMITAQRNFQANAQMISTSDQITQTIINMR